MKDIGTNNKLKIGVIIFINIIIMSITTILLYFNISKPLFYEEFMKLGNKFLNESKYEEAILEFEKAIYIEPKSTEARIENGKAYICTNKVDNAVEEFKEAQNIDIENINLLLEILEILKDIDSESAYEILQNYIDKTQSTIPNDIQEIINNSNDKPKSPIINPTPGTYINPINIKLDLDKLVVGYTFYYTLDGSEPSKESTKYNGSIDIKENTTIKLIAYNHKGESSEAITLEYIIDNKMMDKLNELIKECKVLIKNTEEGTNVGNCIKGSKVSLQNTIKNINYELENKAINYEKAIDIQSTTNSAIQLFKDKIIEKTDKSELKKVINKAQSLHDNSIEGKEEGQYKIGSKVILLKHIDEVKKVYDDILSRQNDIDNAINNLNNAIYNFENSKMKNLRELGLKYTNKLQSINKEYEDLYVAFNDIDSGISNMEMGNRLDVLQEKYENLINDIYVDLQKYLPDNQIASLKQDKNSFINNKQSAIKDIDKALEESHGTWGVTAYSSAIIDIAKEHCNYLINKYMN